MTSQPNTERMLSELFNKIGVAVIVVSRNDGKILYVNEQVCCDLEMRMEELLNMSYKQVLWPEFVAFFEGITKRCSDGKAHTSTYYWSERLIWEQITCQSIDWCGIYPAFVMTITNITEATCSSLNYEHETHFDNTLRLPNEKKLEADVNQLVCFGNVVLLYLKIERLEEVNHVFGFHAGDQLLKNVREWLLRSETKRIQLYHMDRGFVILGRDMSLSDAKCRAELILKRFEKSWLIFSMGIAHAIFSSVKIGIVSGRYPQKELRNLLLRTVETESKEGYTVYNAKTDRDAKSNLSLRHTFINCVQNNMQGFALYFQPIVKAGSDQWCGAEALCRWTTPEGERVSPKKFIPMAEQLELIGIVDNWVRKTAIKQCIDWNLHHKFFFLSLNFSPRQAINKAFVDSLANPLGNHSHPGLKINLEITESAKMPFGAANIEVLHQLREIGVSLSLDDFGSGYSSFENLIKISPSAIKTEKALIDGIEHDKNRRYLLKVLIDMTHHLDMKMIAEGVETNEQKRLLESLEVDYMQGYLFSKPISAERMQEELWRFE